MWVTLVVAWRAIKFYAACIHWAATGTLSRANATYGIVGVLIIYAAGLYVRDKGTLKIPDDGLSNVRFIIIAIFLTWILIFLCRLLGAPGRLYGDVEKELVFLRAQSSPNMKVSLVTPTGVQTVNTLT